MIENKTKNTNTACEVFLRQVLKQVKFLPDRRKIRRELLAHIEDCAAADDSALNVQQAIEQAVDRMGDGVQIGKALNKEHGPILGVIWLLSSVLAALAIAVLLFTAWDLASAWMEGETPEEYMSELAETQQVAFFKEADEAAVLWGLRYQVEGVLCTEQGALYVIVSVYDNRGKQRTANLSPTIALSLPNDEADYFWPDKILFEGKPFKDFQVLVWDGFAKESDTIPLVFTVFGEKAELTISVGQEDRL